MTMEDYVPDGFDIRLARLTIRSMDSVVDLCLSTVPRPIVTGGNCSRALEKSSFIAGSTVIALDCIIIIARLPDNLPYST